MKKLQEKRISGIEIRTCINCGKQWEVRVKPHKKTSSGRKFCSDCIKTLSTKEKQHIWRAHSSLYVEEERECVNCGKKWKITTKIGQKPAAIKLFCGECNKNLTQTEKKHIYRKRREGYHEKEKAQRKASYRRNHIHNLVHNAKERAIKYGYEFDIKDSDIVIPDKCPLLDVPFIMGEKGDYEYTPTIDRIDNNRGYTKDNIWVITKKANVMKNSASFSELYTFCTNVLRYSLNNSKKEAVELQDKELVR